MLVMSREWVHLLRKKDMFHFQHSTMTLRISSPSYDLWKLAPSFCSSVAETHPSEYHDPEKCQVVYRVTLFTPCFEEVRMTYVLSALLQRICPTYSRIPPL